MMDVTSPRDPSIVSRQPIGRLAGTGGGPSLMLNGHMDPGVEMSGWSVDPYGAKFEDGWVWGMGAHDDKGGIAAMVSAVDAVIRSGTRLAGDVLVCPVVAHKYGGAGTRALLAHGVTADLCINLEHSANTIANVCVGIVMARVRTSSPDLFFRFSDEARAAFWNPVEQQGEILRRIGPSLTPAGEDSWMTFTPHPDLEGFPMHNVDVIHKEHYYQPNFTGLSTRDCDLVFQVRTVPGQTVESVRADVERLLDGIARDHPAFRYELELPAAGTESSWCQDPMEMAKDHPLVVHLAEGARARFRRGPARRRLRPLGERGRRQHPRRGRGPEPPVRARGHPHLRRVADPRRAGATRRPRGRGARDRLGAPGGVRLSGRSP